MRRHVRVISQGGFLRPATVNRPAASQLEQMTQLVGLMNALLGTFQNAIALTQSALAFVRTDLQKDTQP